MIHEPLFVSADFSASQNSLAHLHLESFCDKFKLYGNPTQCNTIQRIKGQFWNFNLQLSYLHYVLFITKYEIVHYCRKTNKIHQSYGKILYFRNSMTASSILKI